MALQDRFHDLLVRAAAELYQDHRDRMQWPDLIPPPTRSTTPISACSSRDSTAG
jgi:hypothetical protein